VDEKLKIESSHLIICEGRDALSYMICFLKPLIKTNNQFGKFQVMNPGGINQLHHFIENLPNLPNFPMVESIMIARDAEKNPKGASQAVQASLKKGGFSVPDAPGKVAYPAVNKHNIKVGYVLFPKINSDDTSGTLEDLCLSTLASPDKEKILEIADSAIESVKKQTGKLKRPHKNRFHTYLSLTNDFVGMKIAQASRKKAFDFCSDETKALKELLAAIL